MGIRICLYISDVVHLGLYMMSFEKILVLIQLVHVRVELRVGAIWYVITSNLVSV